METGSPTSEPRINSTNQQKFPRRVGNLAPTHPVLVTILVGTVIVHKTVPPRQFLVPHEGPRQVSSVVPLRNANITKDAEGDEPS